MFVHVYKADILLESWNPRFLLRVFENMEERLGCGEDFLIRRRHFLKLYFLADATVENSIEIRQLDLDFPFRLSMVYEGTFSLVDVVRERIRRGFVPMNWKEDFIAQISEIELFQMEKASKGGNCPFPEVSKIVRRF
ncbi:MAG: hypothetical protein AAB355_00655 [Patescibacteria group bacterium]